MIKFRKSFLFALCVLIAGSCIKTPSPFDGGESGGAFVSDFTFDPEEVEANILSLIEDSEESITVSLYGFDNDKIADALIEAHRDRGINVRMSTEYDSVASYASWRDVIQEGIPVRVGNDSGIMHNKYLIFDDKYMITGSTNLTGGMFRHFNNTIIFRNEDIIQEYKKDFEVQFADYYEKDKDEGYDEVIGGGADIDWEVETYSTGQMQISPYFTPYQKTITEYGANIISGDRSYKAKDCNNAPASCSNVCFWRTSENTCHITEPQPDGCETIVDYYDPTRSGNTVPGTVYKYFNPDKGDDGETICQKYSHALNVVVKTLREAEKSIRFLVFAFTDRVLMQELIRAKKMKNVDVRVWMDSRQYRSSFNHSSKSFKNLAEQTGHFRLARRPNGGLLHHKVIIVDDKTIILGSMNYSSNAVNKNDENFLLIRNAESLARKFKEEITAIDNVSTNLLDQQEFAGAHEDDTEQGNL